MNKTAKKNPAERPILMTGEMVRATLEDRKGQTRRIVTDANLVELFEFLAGPEGEPGESSRLGVETVNNFNRQKDGGSIYKYSGLLVHLDEYPEEGAEEFKCRFGVPGDRIWVRETHKFNGTGAGPRVTYRADGAELYFKDAPDSPAWIADDNHWRPSIFMPRWASRISLEITKIRVERLNEISEEDAKAEGIRSFTKDGILKKYWPCDFCEGDFKCAWRDMPHTAKEAYRALWEHINGLGSWAKNPWVWVIEFKRIKGSK